VGTNHFGFVHKMLSQGREVTSEAVAALSKEPGFELAPLLNAVPIGYVNYFFHRQSMLKKMRETPLTRGQEVEAIEGEIFREAADPSLHGKPKALERRGGGGYSEITFSVMKAIATDSGEKITCNVPSQGSVDGVDAEAVMEVVCEVSASGARPLPVGGIPLAFRGLVRAVKDYESLTVAACMQRDRRLALQALMTHPLAGDLDIIEPMLDELCAAHGISWEKA
jgi:6-phospho-beta-glucosidase